MDSIIDPQLWRKWGFLEGRLVNKLERLGAYIVRLDGFDLGKKDVEQSLWSRAR